MIRIWNYNKGRTYINKGVRNLEILLENFTVNILFFIIRYLKVKLNKQMVHVVLIMQNILCLQIIKQLWIIFNNMIGWIHYMKVKLNNKDIY